MHGMTLIELLIGIVITGILLAAAAPPFADYIRNSKLRESGNVLVIQTLAAQGEAIRRNATISLVTSNNAISIVDPSTAVVLRRHDVSADVSMGANTFAFGSDGRPTPVGTSYSINLSMAGFTCNAENRCPGLRVTSGGAVRLCRDHTNSSDCP
jgi:type IV fimbrial biogenesis protein FimT